MISKLKAYHLEMPGGCGVELVPIEALVSGTPRFGGAENTGDVGTVIIIGIVPSQMFSLRRTTQQVQSTPAKSRLGFEAVYRTATPAPLYEVK
jgi:hypothetical protein